MDSLWQDLRYGLRGLRNQPGFAALAVLTLALGVGATTAMFSVIYNVLFDPFPYKDANRVIAFQIRPTDRANQSGRSWFQTPEWLDYRAQSQVFEEVIATGNQDVLLTTTDGTEQLDGGLVSDNMFTFLGVPPVLGRALTPDDAKPGASPVFVMAYKMWSKHFNLDPGVVNRTFTMNGVPTTCVGVMPRRFTKMNADLYLPVVLDRADPRVSEQYFMFQARLKPGVTNQQAEAEISVLAQQLSKVYPRNYPPKFIVKVVSWVDNVVGGFRKTLSQLAAAVALLLLIACGNVANMLLARATVREKEMAIRASLGASRGRLVRQLLMESVLLALMGAAVGAVFAYFGLKALVAFIPDGAIPHEAVIQLNTPVLLFSLGIAVLTAIVFGLAPALQTARQDLVEPLKDGGKGSSGGFRRGKLRRALVVGEVALSLMLLVGAGLLMHSFIKLQTVDLGFNPNKLLVARLPLPRGQYDTAAEKQRYFTQLLARLQALPGVTAAATITSLPPFGGPRSEIDITGKTHADRWDAQMSLCSEGYLATMGPRLLRGRFFNESEVNGARRLVVVNQEFVKRYFGSDDPIGGLVKFNNLGSGNPPVENPPLEIIGVVSDVKNRGIDQAVQPEAFMPYTITGSFDRGIVLRTAGEPLALVQSVRREIWAQDRNVAVTTANSMNNLMRDYIYASPRFSLLVLGVFAAVGLILVGLGVYSVIAYTVSRQTHEIGIRMALGATRRDVLGLVLWMGLKLVVYGVVVGVAVSLGITRLLELTNQLGNVPAHDPVTYVLVVLVVGLAGLAACYFPARRATKVDPMIALRRE
jgi:putative ABC transport system permease protein